MWNIPLDLWGSYVSLYVLSPNILFIKYGPEYSLKSLADSPGS